jgi:tetratricopeptide (TPR) repeat protein
VKRGLIYSLILLICLIGLSCAKKKPKLDTEPCKKAKGYFLLSVSYINADDPTSALEQLFKGQALCPHDPEIQNALGLVYFAKQRFAKAVNHFELALQYAPDDSDARHNLGIVYVYLNRYDEAIVSFKIALENDLYRNQANSLNAIGWAYYKKGEYTEAEGYFKKTLEHSRMYLPAYDNLAKVYIALDRFEDAIKELTHALELNDLFPEARLDLGICYLKLGDKEKAKEQFKKVLATDPLGKLGSQAQEFLKLLE